MRIAILSANYGGSVVRQECEYGMLYTVAALPIDMQGRVICGLVLPALQQSIRLLWLNTAFWSVTLFLGAWNYANNINSILRVHAILL